MAAINTISASESGATLSGSADRDRIIIGYPVKDGDPVSYDKVTVEAGAGNDTVQMQYGNANYIDVGAGNDSVVIYEDSSASTVVTGEGNDTVAIWATDTTTLELGKGTNVIMIAADANLAISSAADADVQYVFANGATIGKTTLSGSDGAVLRGTGGNDLFKPGSGSNTIVSYGGEDTIQFTSTSSSVDGNDVILVGSNGTLTVANGAAHKLNVNGSTVSLGSYKTYTPQEVIKKFMASLDNTSKSGTAALDEAVLSLNVDAFGSMQDVIDAAVADCKKVNNADTFLRDYCGIILDNKDTGALTGWDAMGSTVKTSENVMPESGSFDTFSQDSFTIDGLTVKLDKSFDSLTDNQKTIYRGLHTWWTTEALKLISDSYGTKFSFGGGSDIKSTAKTITVKFVGSGSFLAQVTNTAVKGETSSELTLQINEKFYNPLDDSNVNGYSTVKGSGYLDRTLAHEFTHAIMAATIQDFNSLPAYVVEGMAELTHGIDDERATLISSLGGSSSKLKSALGTSTKTGNVNNYAGGYILLRYMALQAANSEPATGVRVNSAKKTAVITASDANTITTVDGSTEKFDGIVTLDASSSSRAIYIIGTEKDNVIIGGAAGGTLDGGKGKDKLYGGAGTDVFVHSIGSGNDVLGNTKDATSLYSTGDKIVIVGDESLTTEGALTFKDAKAALTVSFTGTKETLVINKADATAPVTLELATAVGGSALKTLTHGEIPTGVTPDSKNAALVTIGADATSTIDISDINTQLKTVNAKEAGAAYIIGSNYAATTVSLGGNNTTVSGGYDYAKNKGFNDVFYGSDGGKDVFVYSLGGGNDKIVGVNGADGDAIVLLGFDEVTTIGTSGEVFYKENAKGLVITLNSGTTKGNLTVENINTSSKLRVYKNSVSEANQILDYGVIMPDGVGYGKSNAILTVGGGTSADSIGIDLSGDGYSGNVKEVDASTYEGKVSIVGNNNTDALTASKAGGTLDGGSAIDAKGNPKATGDKLYGNVGADTFIYRALESIGGGTDIIGGNKKFEAGNYDASDRIIITAPTAPSASDIVFTDAKDITTITINGDRKSKLTVNKISSDTAISVCVGTNDGNLSNVTTAVTHGSIPSGVGFGTKGTATDYTTLTIGSASANSTVNASTIHSQIKTIDATKAQYLIKVVGNAAANNISIGGAGGTLDGGAGNDKLFGGTGNDVFYYTLGEGNDEITGYDGSKDSIIISGFGDSIDPASKMFKDNNGTITLDLASDGTKGKLTIKNAEGKVTVKDAAGNTILNYRENLPDTENITIVKNIMVIGADASLGSQSTFKASDYGVNVKGINAAAYSTTALCLISGDVKNTSYELTAGSAGSTLKGGAGTDKLFGGAGKDVFVYSVGGGNDVISSLNGGDGDEVVLLGYSGTIDLNDAKVFKDSGKDITLTLNNQKLSIKNPEGQLKLISATQAANGSLTYGNTITYGVNLPTGVEYQSGKTVLAVTENATAPSLAFDLSDTGTYYSKLKNFNATLYGGAVNVTGNGAANELRAGKGGSTLDGGAGNDNLFGNSNGADVFVLDMNKELKNGKDVVRNYNQANGDVISLTNVDAASVKATYNGKTLILTAAGSSDSQKTATFTVYGTTENFKNYSDIGSTTKVAISINGESHTYQFLKSTKAKLLTEIVAAGEATRDAQSSGGQLPSDAEDYWFTQPTGADIDATDELSDIMEINPLAESLKLDDPADLLDRSDKLLAPSSILKGASRHGARNK